MKIAFFVNQFPSLSETFVLEQIVGLLNLGHTVHIYPSSAQDVAKVHPLVEQHQLTEATYYHPKLPSNYLIRCLKGIWLFFLLFFISPSCALQTLNVKRYGQHARSLRLLYRAFPLIKNRHPHYDIIMCHFGERGLIASDLKTVGVISGKLCVAFHGFDLSAYIQTAGENVYDALFTQADLILPISHFWQQRLTALGCSPDKIEVHHMGIDFERFAFEPRTFPTAGSVKLVSVARLVEKKGIEYSIRALQKTVHHYPDIEYTVIGAGPLLPELSLLVQNLGLENVVHLVGWCQQTEVVQTLQQAHIFLAPSVTSESGDMEGIPVVLMEAMAMGLPVISTQHSGIPELIHHGVSGFLVPERDSEALAAQLISLLNAPQTWSDIGKAGHCYVKEQFNNQCLTDDLANRYQSILLS